MLVRQSTPPRTREGLRKSFSPQRLRHHCEISGISATAAALGGVGAAHAERVYQFPSDSAQYATWTKAVRRENFVPTKYTVVCEHHFHENGFVDSASYTDNMTGKLLRDGLLENQTAEYFETVFKIKIDGTRHLDELSCKMCPELDHFVCFSSLASGMGNVGQTNYGYANSAMERICELRAARGLPGLAIQWGAIADVGVFHEIMGDDATIAGTTPQRISSCITLMDQFLNQNHPVVSSCVKADLSTEGDSNKCDLVAVIARILGVKDPASLNHAICFSELGMDSLMAVEVRQAIERYIGLTLSMQEIRQLTMNVLQKLNESTRAN
ncbi:hypothetical protein HPB49_004325 [Dermacentor silvarum]|uniref:Uncharacterized protein n=1 Tax=Dermacentor silvarum TaxID=543639 RepID=A0ACB8D2X8_DERSI|nr:hypothetical protein HPB49_004325 [Dermacentor silvarum]